MKKYLFFVLLLAFMQTKAQDRESSFVYIYDLLDNFRKGKVVKEYQYLAWPDKRCCDTCTYPYKLAEVVVLRVESASLQEEESLLKILPRLTELRGVEIRHVPHNYVEFFQALERLDKLEYVVFRCFPYDDIDDLDFPYMISKLKKIKYLSVISCRLSAIPPEIGELTQLEQLFFMDNDFTDFPKEFSKLHNLRILRIGVRSNTTERLSSRIKYISESVLSLPNLEELTIRSPSLREIPCGLMNMPKLKKVKISKNSYITEKPNCIKKNKFRYFRVVIDDYLY
jgi:hypothetical protein